MLAGARRYFQSTRRDQIERPSFTKGRVVKPKSSPIETLRALYEEAREDISRRLQGLTDLDGKANQVMGLSATIIAIVLAGVSIVADQTSETFFRGHSWIPWLGIVTLAVGIILLLLAIIWSIKAYIRKDVPVGISDDDLSAVLDRGMDEANYLEAAIAANIEGIRALKKENLDTAGQLRLTIRFFLTGLVLVACGAGILIGRVLAI